MKIYSLPFLNQSLLILGIVLISSKTNFCQAQYWTTSGNAITGSNFLGTTNNEPLIFKANTHVAMVILGNGNVGIGTSDPNYPFQIDGDMVDSGTIYTTNLEISHNLSIGQFKMVHGVIDSIISTSGNLQLSATVVNSDGSITAAQMVTAGNGDSAITIDGDAGTITSMTQTVSFGNDTIATTGKLKAAGINISGNSVAMPGIVVDTNTELMGIDKHGHVTPLTANALNVIMYPPINCNPISYEKSVYCANNLAGWGTLHPSAGPSAGIPCIGTNNACSFVGIGGTPNYPCNPSFPDAPLNISDNFQRIQFSITNPFSLNDVFTIDYGGNTYMAGNVGILTEPTSYALDVNGVIRANEVKVCVFGTCDFVFDENYKLMPLADLEKYLNLNHHLPGIPSAKEMESDDGIALGKMNSQLLQKIEELTLYVLQQQKEIEELKMQVQKINSK